jgi:hypothetical protein
MEETNIVILVGSSLVLEMEYHKGGFPGNLKGLNNNFSSQITVLLAKPTAPYLDHRLVGLGIGKIRG